MASVNTIKRQKAVLKAATRIAKVSKQTWSELRDTSMYLFVENSQVIGFTSTKKEALRLAKKHPGAAIYTPDYHQDAATLKDHFEYLRKSDESYDRRNPVAGALGGISNDLLLAIEGLMEGSVPGFHHLDDTLSCNGTVAPKEKERRATNAECCKWTGDLEVTLTMDLRQPLPPQMAKQLRAISKGLADVADAIEQTEDDRDMTLIKKVVEDETYLHRLAQKGKYIDDMSGEIESIPSYRKERILKQTAPPIGRK